MDYPDIGWKRVLDCIAVNLAEDLSLSELAAQAGLSRRYCAEAVQRKKHAGRAPHRLLFCCSASERRNRSKTDAGRSQAHRSGGMRRVGGFQNPTHFARMFRRFVGVNSPLDSSSTGRLNSAFQRAAISRCDGDALQNIFDKLFVRKSERRLSHALKVWVR